MSNGINNLGGINVIETRTNARNVETYVFEFLAGRYVGKFGIRSYDRNKSALGKPALFDKQYATKAEAVAAYHG